MCNGESVNSELPRDELSVEVLRYLITHPMAKDTINGIQKCWLSKSTRGEGKRKLEKTCDLLVTKGWLIARRSPQSETIYSLNENGLSEINAFLNDEPQVPGLWRLTSCDF